MYIFNLNYKFRNDINRLILVDDYKRGGQEFKSFVHPVYAWLINLFDGHTALDEILTTVCNTLSLDLNQARSVIEPLLDNEEELHIRYGGVITTLPPHVITVKHGGQTRTRQDDGFFASVTNPDHAFLRLKKPMSLLLCPSLRCYTDCIYCYADRKHPHKELDASFWANLVRQAHEQDIDRIDVTGGEFFMMRDWQQIAKALVECGYIPEISTKIPLTESTLDDILASGLGCVQFSLDILDAQMAVDTLKVNLSYVEQLKSSIRYADRIGLAVILKPTLSRMTCTKENVRSIIGFADSLKNLRRVVVSTIGYSCYKPRTLYADIRPTMTQVDNLRTLLDDLQTGRNYPVIDDSFTYRPHEMQNGDVFADRPYCTANMDGLVILPNGDVTICEELYWHPSFILGNCTTSSLTDIWQSEKAVGLYHLQNSDFPADSACADCKILTQCRTGQGVCWKLVLAAYGMDKPLYPDPRCPQSGVTDDAFLIP